MNVTVLSTDRKLFEEGSAVANRYRAYGEAWGRVNVVVLGSTRKHPDHKRISDSVTVYAARGTSIIGLLRAIRITLSLPKADVVIAQEPTACGVIALFARAPMLVELHTDVTHPIYRATVTGWLRTRIIPFILRRATRIRAVSQSVKDVAMRYVDPKKIDVLPIAVDISSLSRAEPPERPTLLMVTRFTPEKDVETGLRVLEHLIPRIPEVQLVIVGTGPGVYGILHRTRQFGDHLVLRGFVPQPFNEIGAHVFLHTSLVEGYGLALIEAGGVGLPIVTTDVGIAREVYGEGAVLAKPGDAAALAEACYTLLEHPSEALKEGGERRAEALAHTISFSEYVARYAALVRNVAES